MKILKFGGSSVGSPERIKRVIDIVLNSKQNNQKIAVVFSAFQGVTDELVNICNIAAIGDESYKENLKTLESKHFEVIKSLVEIKKQSKILANTKLMINELEDILHGVYLIKELTPKILAFILSFGERLSGYIISECLKQQSSGVEFLDARKVIKTDENFTAANVKYEITYQNIRDYFEMHSSLQVITGFIGSTVKGETTTLGRGGSDYTASILGAALKVAEIEIWTDVDGVMTADPRTVANAFPIKSLTYVEAMEMSHFGAKVIYPPTIQPALEQKIPIRIKNVFNPDFEGTVISEKSIAKNDFIIKGISSIENIALLRAQGSGMIGVVGIAGRLFSALSREKINVILITQASSEHSICFAIERNEGKRAKKILEQEFSLEIQAHHIDEIIVEKDLSIVAVVGENMRKTPGIASRLFQALGSNGINIVAIAQGSSELNISVVIDARMNAKALNAIHEIFFFSKEKKSVLD